MGHADGNKRDRRFAGTEIYFVKKQENARVKKSKTYGSYHRLWHDETVRKRLTAPLIQLCREPFIVKPKQVIRIRSGYLLYTEQILVGFIAGIADCSRKSELKDC